MMIMSLLLLLLLITKLLGYVFLAAQCQITEWYLNLFGFCAVGICFP